MLIVEDEPIIRQLLRYTLERADYTVLEAADGLEAVEVLDGGQHRVSAIVSDITMPRMDGLELVERLEVAHPTVPIILASGLHRLETIPPFVAARVVGFLDKPYSRSSLLATVARAVDGVAA